MKILHVIQNLEKEKGGGVTARNIKLIKYLEKKDIKNYTISLKSKNIASTCGQLVRCHQGMVPNSREELEKLPGVGRKTANVILNTAFGKPVIAVDTHVFRISNRTGLANGDTVLEVENKLMTVVPSKWKKDAHHLLILQGRYVCKSRNPECVNCVIVRECEYQEKSVL